MINAIQIALTGLHAASRKADTAASNIANQTTGGALDPADGPQPYNALTSIQTSLTDAEGQSAGVTAQTVPTNRPFVPVYDPDSPFANEDGMAGVPNIDLAEEAVNLQIARTAYKANVKTIEVASDMQDELLKVFDRDA